MSFPTHITIGELRRIIEGLPDESELCVQYGDVVDDVFIRVDGLHKADEGAVLTLSLVPDHAEEEE